MDPSSLLSSSLKEEDRTTTTSAPPAVNNSTFSSVAASMNDIRHQDDASSMDNDDNDIIKHTKGHHASTNIKDEMADNDSSSNPAEEKVPIVASAVSCKKHQKRSSSPTVDEQNQDFLQQQNNSSNDALSILMTTARQNAAAKANKRRRRCKPAAERSNAFDEMMHHAKTNPSAFAARPSTKVLLEHCQKVANLVVTMRENDDYDNDDDEAHDDDSLLVDDENTNVSKAVKDVQKMQKKQREACAWKRYYRAKNMLLDQVFFASSGATTAQEEEVGVDDTTMTSTNAQKQQQQQQQEPEEGIYVKAVWGYIDKRLKHRHVILGLTFYYSNRTQITYYAKGEEDMIEKQGRPRFAINCSIEKEEFWLDEGEHLLSMETTHYSLPRMLQRVVFHTSTGDTISIGETRHAPTVAVHRHLKIDDKKEKDHVIRGLEWYAEESMVLSLKTQSLDAIRLQASRDDAVADESSSSSSASSLVHLAHQAEYKRLRDQAQDLETKAMSRTSRNWTHVRHRVGQVGEKYQKLLRETDEAKALKEIKIVQDVLEERFRKKAKLLKIEAQKEMDAVVNQGSDKQEKIKDDYVSNGSGCLQEHQAVVNHLSLMGLDRYASMKEPTVCSALDCRKTFDLAKRSATERCSFPNCCTITQAPNCGCQVNLCSVCSEPYCKLHYDDHNKWCKYKVKQKCGYHNESGTLTRLGCHKRSRDPMRTCCTCSVQCCEDCSSVCAACADQNMLHHDADEYCRFHALCKQCQFVVGDETVCHGCYQGKAHEWNDSDSD